MEKWLQLDPSALNPGRVESVQGVNVKLLVSPHNVPQAVRGFYDRQKERFVIEFKYLDEETLSPKSATPETTLLVGKRSGRLYGIELDVAQLKARHIQLEIGIPSEIKRGLEYLQQHPFNLSIKQNYSVADQVIAENTTELLEALHA